MPHGDITDESDRLMSYESVQLFVERASATRAGFHLDRANALAVAEICRRLDGIPLAIELAAARVGMLSPQAIAGRLDDRFRLLTSGVRAASPHENTLAAALLWSYHLLSPTEQRALRELSVFAGSFSLKAAEGVLGAGRLNRGEVFELLASLVDKSLVAPELQGHEPRYRLLETIRHFARERLVEAGDEGDARTRHAAWFSGLSERAAAEGSGRTHQVWTQWLEADHENIGAALEWSLAEGRVEEALHLAVALIMSWTRRGHFGEARRWLARAFPRIRAVDPDVRLNILATSGSLAYIGGDFASARLVLEECLPLATGATRAAVLKLLGMTRVFVEHPMAGLPLLEESIELARAAGAQDTVIEALALKGRAHLFLAETGAARAAFEESLREAAVIDSDNYRVPGLIGLGWTDLLEGNHVSAEALLGEALRLSRDQPPYYDKALALSLLAEVAAAQANTEVSEQGFRDAEALSRLMQTPFPLARSLVGRGRLALPGGDLLSARALFEEAVSLGRRSQVAYVVVRGLHGLGDVAEAAGDTAAARAWFQEALGLARDKADKQAVGAILLSLGGIALGERDDEQAAPLLHDALGLLQELGDPRPLAAALELVAGLAAIQGRSQAAVRLFAAVQRFADSGDGRGAGSSALDRARRQEHLAELRRSLAEDEFNTAWAEGTALSLDEAIAYARRGRGARARPPSGWGSLTRAERDVVDLVKLGLSNAEIAARLFVSPRTVQWHLSAVFRKVGVRSRSELTREALLRSS